jgi:hypothetical protein
VLIELANKSERRKSLAVGRLEAIDRQIGSSLDLSPIRESEEND